MSGNKKGGYRLRFRWKGNQHSLFTVGSLKEKEYISKRVKSIIKDTQYLSESMTPAKVKAILKSTLEKEGLWTLAMSD